MSASPYREFHLIEELLQQLPHHRRQGGILRTGAGDDAAALHTLHSPVITTDTQREGIHFQRAWLTGRQLGYKAAMVCLSDLAASYATPQALFINLCLPENTDQPYLLDLYRGFGETLDKCGGVLAGGNISGSRENDLAIDLFAIGEGYAPMPLRSNARPGELLCSSGYLGLARAGLHALMHGHHVPPSLLEAFRAPRARFDAAPILHTAEVTTLMDISDGLQGDSEKIASASGVSIELHIAQEHLHPDLREYATQHHLDPIAMIAGGGEDYELLFTCSEQQLKSIRTKLPTVQVVGRILPRGAQPVTGAAGASFVHGVDWKP